MKRILVQAKEDEGKKKKGSQLFPETPRIFPPRRDLRKPKFLPDDDLDEKDPDLIEDPEED